jgi:hypothetical protein
MVEGEAGSVIEACTPTRVGGVRGMGEEDADGKL